MSIPDPTTNQFSRLDADDSVGLKHYQLGRSLGEGGFGLVFQAWDTKLQRQVAIKQLKNLEGQCHTASLLQEARLAASLQHPAFVKVFAIEDEQQPPAIIMELVPGETLKQVLQLGALDVARALDVALQVAQAMQAAHASGLTHGDLKPSNLMLQADGRVRILDFGLASQTDVQATTSLNQLDPQGTIAYMAPERMSGAAANPQSDVYALGVILYECLHGSRPFAQLSGLALAAALMQSNSDSWEFAPQTPPAVVKLIHNMTARQPERRLATMQQVVAQLQTVHTEAVSEISHPQVNVQEAAENTSIPVVRKKISKPRTYFLALVATLLFGFGVWKAIPYLDIDTSLLKPYSEALTMQQGLDALKLFDRPGSLDKARQSFETILKHNPDNAAAVAGVSMVYSYRYENEFKDETLLRQADASAQQALKLNSLLALSHVAVAQTLSASSKSDDALVEYDKALALDSENIFAWYGKITVLTHSRRYEEAQKYAEQQMLKQPKERHFADLLGAVFYQMGSRPRREGVSSKHTN